VVKKMSIKEMNRDKVIDSNIQVYYLDRSFGEHYMFMAEQIVRMSTDSIVMGLQEYTDGVNQGTLDGWVTFRYKEVKK
jgi:predicted nucleic acid-binding protein